MGLPAFKHEFEEVLASLPPTPSPARSVAKLDNALGVFDAAAETYSQSIEGWGLRMGTIVDRLKDMFQRASAERDPAVLRYLIDELVSQIIRDLDKQVDELEEWISAPLLKKFELADNSPLASYAWRIVEDMEKKSLKVVNFHFESIIDIRDQLRMLIWDNDPDARGGPSFDRVDELIASLRR